MWKSVIIDKTLKFQIENKLKEIAFELQAPSKLKLSPGLFSGQSGGVLFNFYYNQYKNKKNEDEEIINIFKNIGNTNSYSFSHGPCGILYMLNCLMTNDFIEIEQDIFKDTSSYINEHLQMSLSQNNFDFLHGAFGLLLYLSEKPELADNTIIKKLFTSFLKANEELNDSIRIKTLLNLATGTEGYCLGIAHGSSATILVLIKYLVKFNDPIAYDILLKTINYLQSCKRESKDLSYFPNYITDGKENYPSRLAWCYGDLGCSLALYKAGLFLNKNEMVDDAVKVMLNSAKKRGLKINGIDDPDFCHGTAGVAHFFARLYNYLGREEFREASEYWFKQTIEMATYNDGLAGYKHNYGDEGGFAKVHGLLEGISGIGLTFLSSITETEPKWDSIFLLS